MKIHPLPLFSKVCLAGYHPGPGDGPAITRPCLLCSCNPDGSLGIQCNEQGSCPCKPGVAGPRFAKDRLAFFTRIMCRSTPTTRDIPYVKWLLFRCDQCQANHWGFPQQGIKGMPQKMQAQISHLMVAGESGGCKPCGCLEAGSLENRADCNVIDGSCLCKQNVEGRHCDQCRQGHFKVQ